MRRVAGSNAYGWRCTQVVHFPVERLTLESTPFCVRKTREEAGRVNTSGSTRNLAFKVKDPPLFPGNSLLNDRLGACEIVQALFNAVKLS